MTGYTANQELTADQMPGIVTAPISTTANGTATTANAVSEIRDAVLGNLTFNALGAYWYKVVMEGIIWNMAGNIADIGGYRIRDGGSSTPTTASTLIAEMLRVTQSTGSGGRIPHHFEGLWVPAAGTHTLSMFSCVTFDNTGADGTQLTPLSAAAMTGGTGARTMYVELVGPQ